VDGLSVAIQVIIFVGIGYFAGEKVEWAHATSEKIVLLLAVIAFASILITWVASVFMRRLSARKQVQPKKQAGSETRKPDSPA
jgi:membrane protein DedA with SNARE-associated domain